MIQRKNNQPTPSIVKIITLIFGLLVFTSSNLLFSQLVINEFQAYNESSVMDPNSGNFSGWIEIFNNTESSIPLSGYYISNDPDNLTLWKFPSGSYMSNKSYITVWVDGTNQSSSNNYHTNFTLSGEGGKLFIYSFNFGIVDSLSYGEQYMDISFGRFPNATDNLYYFKNHTNLAANNSDTLNNPIHLSSPTFSVEGGLFNAPISVEITNTDTTGSQIYYTTDGSIPDNTSVLYSSSVNISGTTVLRAVAYHNNKIKSNATTQSYIFDGSPTLPVVSISIEETLFSGATTGFYNDLNKAQQWERAANIEFYGADDSLVINTKAGLKLYGDSDRDWPMKSISVNFDQKYGESHMKYKIFEDRPTEYFETFVLRNSGNDWPSAMIRDGLMQNLVKDIMNIDYQEYQPCNVYINGEYWGIHNIRETINEQYIQENYGFKEGEIDLLENNAEILAGSSDHYLNLDNYIKSNDLTDDNAVDYVETQMDLNEYLNYQIAQIYFGNYDWPNNNIQYWRPQKSDGKWRWILCHTDAGFGLNDSIFNMVELALGGSDWSNLHMRGLLQNENVKSEFVQRFATHLNTSFLSSRVTPFVDSLEQQIETYMPGHITKWGAPADIAAWNSEIAKLKTFAQNRPDTIRKHITDFFGLTDVYQLDISNNKPEKGYIEIGGIAIPYQYSGLYFSDLPVRVKAKSRPGYKFERWEGASSSTNAEIFPILTSDTTLTAVFGPAEPISGITINEISNRPENKIYDTFDELENWIEIYNATETPFDLGGLYLSDNLSNLSKYYISDDYPEITTIPAKGTLLFYTDNNPNEGILHTNFDIAEGNKHIALSQRIDVGYKAIDSVYIGVQYEGSTFSRYPDGAENWQYTPPTPDAPNQVHNFITGVYINEISTDNINQIADGQGEYEDWIEIYNANEVEVDLGGLFITNNFNNKARFRISSSLPDSTTIAPKSYLVLWADNEPNEGVLHLNFELDNTQGQIALVQSNGTDFVDSVSYNNPFSNAAIGRFPDGADFQYVNPSPGESNYANTITGLVINEFSADNKSIISDEYNEYEDWIEIHNTNDVAINVGGLFVTNNLDNPAMHMIPSIYPDSTTIEPGGFLLLWADNEVNQGIFHTNFTLDINGGQLGLAQINGIDFIDSLTYSRQFPDASTGCWPNASRNYQYAHPSPGDSNYLKDFSGIVINEFSASNTTIIADEYGEYSDWIELYNTNSMPVDIGGMLITNNFDKPKQYRIPTHSPDSTTLLPGGHILLWADNEPEKGILHLDIELPTEQGQVGLFNQDGESFVDSISYEKQYLNASYGQYPDASNDWQYVTPTPGTANMVDPVSGLIINEISADNSNIVADENGEYDDWIEIYNSNSFEVNVGGLHLTNDFANPAKYRIPSANPDSTTIRPGGYLVFWADNQDDQGILHLNFTLDSNGDQVGISQINGREFIDSLTFEKQNLNAAIGLIPNGTGTWQYVEPTPGEKNFVRTVSGLIINEFCSENINIITDNKGEFSDWIEIYNENSFPVDIGGLFLTDDLNFPAKYKIPTTQPDSTTIPAGGHIVLWADNQIKEGVLHLGFALEPAGGKIGLVQYNGIDFIDSVSYTQQAVNSAIGRNPDGAASLQYLDASPGSSNYFTEITGLIMNEFSADNRDIITDNHGEYEDYIEIYNSNSTAVDLGGLFITDKLTDLIKYRIPDTKPDSTTIPAFGYMVLFADGETGQGIQHLPFELNADGGQLGLVSKNGKYLIDFTTYGEQYQNSATGRYPNATGNWGPITPTPGAVNYINSITGLYINEYSAHNTSIVKDEHGEFNDWIEIYNNNSEAINLGGLFITNDSNDKTKYRIPTTYPDSTTVPANGYLLLWADNQPDQGILHLGFTLNDQNGEIALVQSSGKSSIDSVFYTNFRYNSSLGRLPNGSGNISYQNCTPGKSNTNRTVSGIYLNELSSNNTSIIADEYGETNDWIEIFNASIYTVDIGGLYISNDPGNKTKFRIPDNQPGQTTIKSKEYLILWADGQAEQGATHLGFELDDSEGEIILSQPNGGSTINNISYQVQLTNSSYGRYPDGSSNRTLLNSTPGRKNSITQANNIIINEYCANNNTIITDNKGSHSDWIEIYNPTSSDVDIAGMYISNKYNNKTMYRIPSSQPDSTTIKARSYLILWADGRPENGVLHLNFELNNFGDQIIICQYDGSSVIDSTSFSKSYLDATYGRYPNASGNFEIMKASPGNANQQVVLSGLIINEFSASNSSIISDENGTYSDWIEIYNNSNVSVNIGGAFITNNLAQIDKYRIPSSSPSETTISPHDYLILWADNAPEKGVLHLGFELDDNAGEIGIAKIQANELIDNLSYIGHYKNSSTSRYPDASDNLLTINPTPGESNAIIGVQDIYINEIKTNNTTSIIDEHGDFDDWIEIYNAGSKAVDVGGLYVTNNMGEELMWRIPSSDPVKTTVSAGGFQLLWVDNEPEQGSNHVGFTFNNSNTLGLFQFHPDGNVLIDSMTFTYMDASDSYGRYPDGGDDKGILGTVTPKGSNILTSIFNRKNVNTTTLHVYPNPSYQQVVYLNKTCNFSVYNSIGVKVMEKVNEKEISTADFEKGWYIVKTDEGEMVKLIVL